MKYEVDHSKFLKVTSAGAYYCMASSENDFVREFIGDQLTQEKLPVFSQENIDNWFKDDDLNSMETLSHMQNINWLASADEQALCSKGKLEDILPEILPSLSSHKKVILADSHGFYLCSSGFPHESAEEISALSADLISLHERHKGALNGNLKLTSSNWGVIDAAGHSQLGFWPLHVGKEVFSLVIGGQALLHKPSYFDLAWLLHTRYAKEIKT